MKRRQKAWVFVSHSTRDLSEIRKIRNETELQGGEPLLFFLKCVSDSDELDILLKREIEARRYFLLCDSAAASASKWVQDEVRHVASLPGKRCESLRVNAPWRDQQLAIARLLREATIYACYARSDRHIVDPLLARLAPQEFGILEPFHPEASGPPLREELRDAIERSGYFLDFLSEASLGSRWCRFEARHFLDLNSNGSRYIPVILEPGLNLESVPEARDALAINFVERNVEAFIAQLERILYPEKPRREGRE
jgi:TIR domain